MEHPDVAIGPLEIYHKWTDCPVCPHCGHVEERDFYVTAYWMSRFSAKFTSAWWDTIEPREDGDAWDDECGICGGKYLAKASITIKFSTEKQGGGD